MPRLQCSDCGYDEKFDRREYEWVDESTESYFPDELSFEEARDRINDNETGKVHMTIMSRECDCHGSVKFNWNGNRPKTVNWDAIDGKDITK